MSGQKRRHVNGKTNSSEAAKRRVRPEAPTTPAASLEPQDRNSLALSEVKSHVAQALHETVMQTLVATTYLAESPTTSRREVIGYLRQATHELRCVIEHFATSEAGNERPGLTMRPSMAPAVQTRVT